MPAHKVYSSTHSETRSYMGVDHKLSARDMNCFVVRERKYSPTDRVFCDLNYFCYLWMCNIRRYRRFNNFGNICKEEHLSYQVLIIITGF